MGRFDEKVVLITGATSGIGRAAALGFADEGASVVVTGRRADAGAQVVGEIETRGGRATFVAADVREEADVAAAVAAAEATFGGLDVAFNNAGGGRAFGPVTEQTAEAWSDELASNLSGVFYGVKHQIPALRRRGGGAIINNASQLGLVGIGGGVAPYVAAKHGVVGLTRAAALEVAQERIQINAIAPAGVDTPLFRSTMGATPEGAEQIRSLHPVKRVATAEEVASLVLYLAGDDATFFTGAAIAMDGGWTAQ